MEEPAEIIHSRARKGGRRRARAACASDARTSSERVFPASRRDGGYAKEDSLLSSSGSGGWEASIRNCVGGDETVLCTCCGAFSDKWASVVKSCGRNVDELKVDWGKPVLPELIDERLATGKYAAVTLIYNETSTGLTNPVYETAEMMKQKYPDVLVFVDAVSGMVGLPLHFDRLGWDVVFASVQKAFAIPPGLNVVAVSNRALEKSKNVPGRGYYFDFQNFAKSNE
ncbi:MAG: aminotransferase class V-fold PLP-dependent enzyme, partial [Planctomycetota bacterium]